jgi:hypothetical protein
MGWSSWSMESTTASGYGTSWLTEAHVKAQADVVHQKLQAHGYQYINIDAGWWMDFNWHPTYEAYGRPAPYAGRFPDGIANVATYVHNEGLKLGIYYAVGLDIPVYNANYPIYGTSCHAQDIAVQPLTKTNGWLGAYAINYSNPCAQAYINSIASEFASWGVDFMKLDGVTPGSGINNASTSDNRPDVQAWSQALQQTGRSIWLELSWSLDHNYMSTWSQYGNGWRIDTDVECYCGSLVTWNNSVKARWSDLAPWIGNAGPGGWNDLDSLDVGNGSLDGLSNDERQSYMTLWAIESAPLYTGDDLTRLDSYGLSLLTNDEVIAVDQAGHPAYPISQATNQQVWFANNGDGSFTVALFNLDSSSATVTASWSNLGFSGGALVHDLWSHSDLGTFSGTFSANLPAHGSRLLKVTPAGSTSYEAEASGNTLGGGAVVASCSACSGGQKVGYLGNGGTLQFNAISASRAGAYTLTLYYVDGSAGRTINMSVNGGAQVAIATHGTNDNNWNFVQSLTRTVNLNAGSHTILFSNASAYAADVDRIALAPVVSVTSYEAEASGNTLSGGASVSSCSACSGGQKVGNLDFGGSVQFNKITVARAGIYTVTVYYVDGSSGRSLNVSANGGSVLTLNTNGTNDNNWNFVQAMVIQLNLQAGTNTILFATTASTYGADLDRITV